MNSQYFSQETFDFLAALADNNHRAWFDKNKLAYEENVRTPALHFIEDMASELPTISPHFLSVPKKVGGSLMRVYRDTRFGNDKTPYKTNIGIQFRHEIGKDVHAPGFYVHIEPGGCFVGAGVWHPDTEALGKIRDAIVEKGEAWVVARDNKKFKKQFTLEGESLINAPRGYAKDHPLLEDLRRKDFIAVAQLSEATVRSKKFFPSVLESFKAATPFMQFLCQAQLLRF